jgi:hypothetical protein
MTSQDASIDLFLFYLPWNEPERSRTDFSLLYLMAASARQAGVRGEIHLYTHESASLPAGLPVTRTVRIAPPGVDPSEIQLIRAYAMLDFVSSTSFRRPTMAVEYDELFENDPHSAFELPFDIGLTYACWTKAPYGDSGKLNGGVVYLNYRNPHAVRSYYAAYVEKFLEIRHAVDARFNKPLRMSQWGGDEITHLRLLPPTAFEEHEQQRKSFSVAGATVMLLESIRFNCQHAERTQDGVYLPTYPQTLVRHFHGWRKQFMAPYAERNLGLGLRTVDEARCEWEVVRKERSEVGRPAKA